MPKLVHITTVPDSLTFLRGQLRFMEEHGFDVSAVSSPGVLLERFSAEEKITVHAVEMPRKITPINDLVSVVRLCKLITQLKPDIVHAHTPKGGLLGMLSARVSGVPIRVYHMRGLPFVTATGWKRVLLKTTERVSCALSTQVICQSPSLREVAKLEAIAPGSKMRVLAGGSNGVDAEQRFNPLALAPDRQRVRSELNIPAGALVIGFIGRLVRDKGISELAEAWHSLRDEFPTACLLLVGPFEPQDPVPEAVRRQLETDDRVRIVGFTSETPRYYAAMDVLALPTYREGFPNVPLEAAAMGLPVVATRIPGCVDAVEDQETGILVPPRDVPGLTEALRRYLCNVELRLAHGRAGRARVLRSFRREQIWTELKELYLEALRRREQGERP